MRKGTLGTPAFTTVEIKALLMALDKPGAILDFPYRPALVRAREKLVDTMHKMAPDQAEVEEEEKKAGRR